MSEQPKLPICEATRPLCVADFYSTDATGPFRRGACLRCGAYSDGLCLLHNSLPTDGAFQCPSFYEVSR